MCCVRYRPCLVAVLCFYHIIYLILNLRVGLHYAQHTRSTVSRGKTHIVSICSHPETCCAASHLPVGFWTRINSLATPVSCSVNVDTTCWVRENEPVGKHPPQRIVQKSFVFMGSQSRITGSCKQILLLYMPFTIGQKGRMRGRKWARSFSSPSLHWYQKWKLMGSYRSERSRENKSRITGSGKQILLLYMYAHLFFYDTVFHRIPIH